MTAHRHPDRPAFNIWQALGGFYGAAGVAAGALASHALPEAPAADMVKTAAFYALIHAAVLACWHADGRLALAARLMMAAGLGLFSGSLICKHLLGLTATTPLAPAGGSLLIAAWLVIGLRALAPDKLR